MKLPLMNDFTGGEVSVLPKTKTPWQYSLLLQNMILDENGRPAKIPGYKKVNTAVVAEVLKTGYEYIKTNGTKELLCAGDNKIYKVEGAVLTEIYNGLGVDALLNYSTMNNLCIMSNGVNAPLKYDGTTVSPLDGTPPAKTFKTHVHKGRLWFIERTDKMKASFSELNDPETQEGYIDFKFVLPTGDELLDIDSFENYIAFYFQNHVVIYSGSTPSGVGSDFAIVKIVPEEGVIDTGGVQHYGNNLAHVSRSGIKTLEHVVSSGNLDYDDLSKAISSGLSPLLKTATRVSVAHYAPMGLMFFLIDSYVKVYSYKHDTWSRVVGADIKGMFNTSEGKLYFCGTGYLYEFNRGWSFNGTAVKLRWETAWFSISGGIQPQYPSEMMVGMEAVSGVTIDFESQYDFLPTETDNTLSFATTGQVTPWDTPLGDTWETKGFFDARQTEHVRVPLFGGGDFMKCIFKNESIKGPIAFDFLKIFTDQGDYE